MNNDFSTENSSNITQQNDNSEQQPMVQPVVQQPVIQPVIQQPYIQQPVIYAPAKVNQPGHGLGVASLVLGIVSLVLTFLSGAGLIPGIVGIVLAAVAKKKGNNEGVTTAGLVMSIITAALSGVVLLACGSVLGCAACAEAGSSTFSSQLMDELQNTYGTILRTFI